MFTTLTVRAVLAADPDLAHDGHTWVFPGHTWVLPGHGQFDSGRLRFESGPCRRASGHQPVLFRT
jgi:hypothetical protein